MSEIATSAAPAATNTGSSAAPAADASTANATDAALEATASTDDGTTVEDIQELNPELSKAEAKKLLKEIKIKFNGQEITEKLPFEIPDDPESVEYMKKQLQMGKLAQSKSQEAAQMKKDVESLFKALTTDTKKVLAELGIDAKKFAEKVINDEIEDMQKSPEQKEKEKLMKELEETKNKLKAEEEAKKSAELQRVQDQFASELDRDITDALNAQGKLPKSPYVVKRVADAMLMAYQQGYSNITVKDIIPLVEKDIVAEIQDMFGAMPDEVMENVLGKGNLDKLRKRRINKIRKAAETASQITTTGNDVLNNSKDKSDNKKSYKDFFKNF